MNNGQAKELLQRYRRGKCSDAEIELVERWYQQLTDTGNFQWEADEREMLQEIMERRLLKKLNEEQKKETSPVVSIARRRWWIAAASVVFLFLASGYFLFLTRTNKQEQIAKALPADIKAPQTNRATITLANGQKIYLDSVGNGSLAMQGNVKLMKLGEGGIAYQAQPGEATRKLEYNTVSNPRGSKIISLLLADGTKVWLNAASSLMFPVSFSGKERKVSITGEAYFEVKHDATRPFIVDHGSTNIRVLGTHFNVNAFHDDNNDVKVTLLEGSVKVNNSSASGLLKPGEQALINNDIKIKSDVDLDKVMAWKNGYFEFDNAGLTDVLREISRWYDVDVFYQGDIQQRSFVGELQRDLSLSEMLKILEKNKVHFRLEGKKLVVITD